MPLTIACGQIEIIAGRPDKNIKTILSCLEQAKKEQVNLLLLPELSVSGCLIGDLWEQTAFLQDCELYGRKIAEASQGITVAFGNVATDWKRRNADGSVRKYNAAFVAQNGRFLETEQGLPFVAKTLLPAYRESDDARYFTGQETLLREKRISLKNGAPCFRVTLQGEPCTLGLLFYEDTRNEFYAGDVPALVKAGGADVLCTLAASAFSLGKNQKRHEVFSRRGKDLQVPLLYCNAIGVQNNGKNIFTFDGQSCVYGPDGAIKSAAPMFKEKLLVFTWDRSTQKIKALAAQDELVSTEEDETAIIFKTLRYGIAAFLRQIGINRMVLGASGGIDSAVTAALFAHILGSQQVLLVNMPSRYNSELTKNLAQQLAENLGCNYTIVPIGESVAHTVEQLRSPIHSYTSNRDFKVELTELMYENMQARDRGTRILAGFSAAFKGGISCNANKAEITVGYGTFYGDLTGLFCPIGDLWKRQVYALGRYLNEVVYEKDVIPEQCFTIRPSAELSTRQTVGRGGDPIRYEYHDYLFRAWVESPEKLSPAETLRRYMEHDLEKTIGCEPGLIDRLFPTHEAFIRDLEQWYNLFAGFASAKRIQSPPILSLSPRAYGFDYREAQLSPYFSLEYEERKEKLLRQDRLF